MTGNMYSIIGVHADESHTVIISGLPLDRAQKVAREITLGISYERVVVEPDSNLEEAGAVELFSANVQPSN